MPAQQQQQQQQHSCAMYVCGQGHPNLRSGAAVLQTLPSGTPPLQDPTTQAPHHSSTPCPLPVYPVRAHAGAADAHTASASKAQQLRAALRSAPTYATTGADPELASFLRGLRASGSSGRGAGGMLSSSGSGGGGGRGTGMAEGAGAGGGGGGGGPGRWEASLAVLEGLGAGADLGGLLVTFFERCVRMHRCPLTCTLMRAHTHMSGRRPCALGHAPPCTSLLLPSLFEPPLDLPMQLWLRSL